MKEMEDCEPELLGPTGQLGPEMPFKKQDKPPLGLTPRYLAEEKRLREVNEAIDRYLKAKLNVPMDWLNEQNYLETQARKHHKKVTGISFMVKGRTVTSDVSVGNGQNTRRLILRPSKG